MDPKLPVHGISRQLIDWTALCGIHWESHHCDCLYADYEWIRDQVSRVRFGIFFPELAQEVLGGTHLVMIHDKVAFENTMQDTSCPRSSAVVTY